MWTGGIPAASESGHTKIAPFSRMSASLTHGARSGEASMNRLGRCGEASATSPTTTESGLPGAG